MKTPSFKEKKKEILVAYDIRKLPKKLELKIIKYGYVRGYPKWNAIQIWSLEIIF
jgi:hypothetical protein